jgi:alanine racemase
MFYNSRLIIDLQALVANWRYLCNQAPNAIVGAVVKANAYGLGAGTIATALYQPGCRTFFVAYTTEGITLRPLVPDATIFVLQGVTSKEDVNLCIQHRLTPVLNSLDQFKLWKGACEALGPCPPAALGIDSGIHRSGLDLTDLQKVDALTHGFKTIPITHYFSHLASSDNPDNPFNAIQLQRFLNIVQSLPPKLLSFANSHGLFLGSAYHCHLIRPGIALYGALQSTTNAQHSLKNVILFESKVLQVLEISKGETISYNQTYTLKRDSRIMCVAIGYADGLSRHLSNKGKFYLNGYELPIVGRVCMDCTMVDATDVPESLCYTGQWVTITDSLATLLALANAADTNVHETLTRIGTGKRTERIYIRNNT